MPVHFNSEVMQSPLQFVPDCAGWHYKLQLNIYKFILESKYGATVASMRVVCLHPDQHGTPAVIEVPVMDHAVAMMVNHQVDSCICIY